MNHVDLTSAVIFGAATLQGILAACYFIFNKKGSRIANFLILGMIVSITLIIFQNFMIFNGSYTKYSSIIFLFYPLTGLIGPFFYMYVVYLLNPNRKFKIYDLLHTVLFFVMLFKHWNFLMLPSEKKIHTVNYFYYSSTILKSYITLELIFYKLILLAYGFASFYLIKNKIKDLKQWTSNTNIQYLNRFKWIIYLFIIYGALSLLVYLFSYSYEITTARLEVYTHLINSMVVVSLSVIVMQQPNLLVFMLQPVSEAKKQQNSDILILKKLKQLMETEKPFLNPDLKLHDLAKLMNTVPYILSEQINQKMHVNFYEFINQYRVEEFKKRVQSLEFEKYTLLAIALDVGFNSKSSFNRIFKQHTQMTPSQYKNQKKVSSSKI